MDNLYKKDTTIVITAEEYSDYGLSDPGVALVLQDFDLNEMKRQYLVDHPEQKEVWKADFDQFTRWLEINSYIKTLTYKELHLGSYRTLEVEDE